MIRYGLDVDKYPEEVNPMRPQRKLHATDSLTKAEAAERAGVTPRTIGRWLADDTVPLHRYQVRVNRVAVSKRELDSFLTARAAS